MKNRRIENIFKLHVVPFYTFCAQLPICHKTMTTNQLSEQLLLSTKLNQPAPQALEQLARMPLTELNRDLPDDAHKLACWINLYNAFFLILRKEKQLAMPAIFNKRAIEIAGLWLSLDDIEHIILRKNRVKWALGYLPNPFSRRVLRILMVAKRDYRIHFALNCGAKSCPPIAFYTPDKIEQQLELATQSFLESETIVSEDQHAVATSRLLWWYRGDFGGQTGIRRILEARLALKSTHYQLSFRAYDWTEDLDNFQSGA